MRMLFDQSDTGKTQLIEELKFAYKGGQHLLPEHIECLNGDLRFEFIDTLLVELLFISDDTLTDLLEGVVGDPVLLTQLLDHFHLTVIFEILQIKL